MTRFSDWLSSAWNTAKNVSGKVHNFVDKAAPIVVILLVKLLLSDIILVIL
jgi:hypothetical protein